MTIRSSGTMRLMLGAMVLTLAATGRAESDDTRGSTAPPQRGEGYWVASPPRSGEGR